MDWKNQWTQCCGKAKKLWAAFLHACGVAWAWSKETWGKTKVWLRKVWNKTNIWLTKAWNLAKICYAKAAQWLSVALAWLKKGWDFLAFHGKRLAGKLAVLALKVRKWFLKKTARLRGWWAQWKGRAWIVDKIEKIREKLPKPAEKPALEEAAQEIMEAEEELYEEETCVQAPVRRTAAPKEHGKFVTILLAIWKVFSTGCVWIYRLRSFIMAVPVAFYAIKLAIANANRLPDMVGMDIQASGEFARMVTRQQAVLGPLGLTAFCLVLVLCSKKPLLPWLISAFTLILPILIWMTNYYA